MCIRDRVSGPEDKAVYTNYQKALSNRDSNFADGQDKTATLRYAHGQDTAGKMCIRDSDETMQKFTEEMQYAQPRGPHAQWPEISDALSLAVNESITGTSAPADAAAKAQSTIDGILAE